MLPLLFIASECTKTAMLLTNVTKINVAIDNVGDGISCLLTTQKVGGFPNPGN